MVAHILKKTHTFIILKKNETHFIQHENCYHSLLKIASALQLYIALANCLGKNMPQSKSPISEVYGIYLY